MSSIHIIGFSTNNIRFVFNFAQVQTTTGIDVGAAATTGTAKLFFDLFGIQFFLVFIPTPILAATAFTIPAEYRAASDATCATALCCTTAAAARATEFITRIFATVFATATAAVISALCTAKFITTFAFLITTRTIIAITTRTFFICTAPQAEARSTAFAFPTAPTVFKAREYSWLRASFGIPLLPPPGISP